jgi:hypothetical protein
MGQGICLLDISYQEFAMNSISSGENYLSQFEKLFQGEATAIPESEYIERAYATAASVYYRKGNYSKSKEKIKKGLKYIPENFKLKHMLTQF